MNMQIAYLLAIVAIIVAGVAVYVKILKSDLNALEAENSSLKTKLEVSQQSVESLRNAITDQNSAIQKLKSDADSKDAAGKILIGKALAEANALKKKAEDIMKSVPTPGKTSCDAANDLFNQEIKSAK